MRVNLPNIDGSNLRTRDRLIDTAARHFAEFGVNGASLRQIALEAQITPAGIYNHFPGGKPELYSAVATIVVGALTNVASEMTNETNCPVAMILECTEKLWLFFERHPTVAMLIAREGITQQDDATDLYGSYVESATAIEAFLVDGIETQQIRPVEPKLFLMWVASFIINFHGAPMLRDAIYRDTPTDVALKQFLQRIESELRLA